MAAKGANDPEKYSAMLDWGLRLVVLLAVPCTVALLVFAQPLVTVLYHYGAFTAHDVTQTTAALTGYGVGVLGLVVTFAPDVWTTLYSHDESVLQSARSYFLWAGPCYGFFGLGLSLYFSSLGAGKAIGPVLAGTLRLALVAIGGLLLAWMHAPAWAIFALVGAGMAVFGLSSVLIVKYTPWER